MKKIVKISIGLILLTGLLQSSGLAFASQVDDDPSNMRCINGDFCFFVCNISQKKDANKLENIAASPDKFTVETDFGFVIPEKDVNDPLYPKNQLKLPEIRAGPINS